MTSNTSVAPLAAKKEKKLTVHGDTRIDNYYWMRLSDKQKKAKKPDKQTQRVLDYIEKENRYTHRAMKHTEGIQKELYDEILGRIKQKDESVPITKNGYIYYTRYENGEDYPYCCRKKDKPNALEEIILDMPKMAKGHEYFDVGGYTVSPNNKLLAYSVDNVSRREYTIYIKDLASGTILSQQIDKTTGDLVWANDNKTLFYSKKDPQTLRANKILRHTLDQPITEDTLVFEEKDEAFSCYITKSKSEKYLFIYSHQTLSTEVRFIASENPLGEWKVLQERERDLEYSVEHYQEEFYLLTNYNAKNFCIMKTPIESSTKEYWRDVIKHREDVLLEDMDIFNDYFVISERKEGLPHIQIISWKDKQAHYITLQDPAYDIYTEGNLDFDTKYLQIHYTSLTTPHTAYRYDMKSREKTIIKQQEVMSKAFSPENYVSERFYITVRDKTKVPVSLVYRKGIVKDKKTPLLLRGYGSYGASYPIYFSSALLSLLDRGFIYAVAHIRGGDELGRLWYDSGKLLHKKNTFYDFIDCAEGLIKKGYTSCHHLYAEGGSAGGLLMGVIMNMRPDLWRGIIADVPFVDVVSTMLDESIPLTTGEFDEWGNPKEKRYYDYMKSYSPYDNVKRTRYPNLLIITGYWDSQVQYWEPLKWMAKLREFSTGENLLLLSCDMELGHSGASGRFKVHKETALKYAFLLDLEEQM